MFEDHSRWQSSVAITATDLRRSSGRSRSSPAFSPSTVERWLQRAGDKQVVNALDRVGVAHQAPLATDCVELREAARHQLMRVDLMAGVPDERSFEKSNTDAAQCTASTTPRLLAKCAGPVGDDLQSASRISLAS